MTMCRSDPTILSMTNHTETLRDRDPDRHTDHLAGFAGPSRMYEDLRRRNERRAFIARGVDGMRAERPSRITTPPGWGQRPSR